VLNVFIFPIAAEWRWWPCNIWAHTIL